MQKLLFTCWSCSISIGTHHALLSHSSRNLFLWALYDLWLHAVIRSLIYARRFSGFIAFLFQLAILLKLLEMSQQTFSPLDNIFWCFLWGFKWRILLCSYWRLSCCHVFPFKPLLSFFRALISRRKIKREHFLFASMRQLLIFLWPYLLLTIHSCRLSLVIISLCQTKNIGSWLICPRWTTVCA
jgi:hypothetical protein